MSEGGPARACPACQAAGARLLPDYSPAPWEVVQCTACGFVFLKNPPGYSALVEDFAWERTSAEVRKRRRRDKPVSTALRLSFQRLVKMVRRDRAAEFTRLFGRGRVLDIGCGRGHRLQAPLVPYGIELSRQLAAEADQRMRGLGGACLHAAGAEGIASFGEEFFDGILMHSYLEHEEAVLPVLKGAFRTLKPGGRIFVRVPNYASANRRILGKGWSGFRYPDHVNYFTPASLADVARQTGFAMTITNWWHLWFDDNIHALLTKRGAAA